MKAVCLKLPERLEALIAEVSRQRQVSKSAVIRECVEQVLVRGKGGRRASCYELSRDLAGCLRGPRDLASNPKYLDDFGK